MQRKKRLTHGERIIKYKGSSKSELSENQEQFFNDLAERTRTALLMSVAGKYQTGVKTQESTIRYIIEKTRERLLADRFDFNINDYVNEIYEALQNNRKIHTYKLAAVLFHHMPEIQKYYRRAITSNDISNELTSIIGVEVNLGLAKKTLIEYRLTYCQYAKLFKGFFR